MSFKFSDQITSWSKFFLRFHPQKSFQLLKLQRKLYCSHSEQMGQVLSDLVSNHNNFPTNFQSPSKHTCFALG